MSNSCLTILLSVDIIIWRYFCLRNLQWCSSTVVHLYIIQMCGGLYMHRHIMNILWQWHIPLQTFIFQLLTTLPSQGHSGWMPPGPIHIPEISFVVSTNFFQLWPKMWLRKKRTVCLHGQDPSSFFQQVWEQGIDDTLLPQTQLLLSY